jgi:hypothetical protein
MHQRHLARLFAVSCSALLSPVGADRPDAGRAETARAETHRSETGRAGTDPKRPLSYDVVDSWRSIPGPAPLERFGQWLAFATATSQARRRARGAEREVRPGVQAPPRHRTDVLVRRTPSLVFSIAQSKADEREGSLRPPRAPAAAGQAAGAKALRPRRRASRGPASGSWPAGGTVTTIEKVSSFRMEESALAGLLQGSAARAAAAGPEVPAGRAALAARHRRQRHRPRRRSAAAAVPRARSARTRARTSFSADWQPGRKPPSPK